MGMPRRRVRLPKCGRSKCRWHLGIDSQTDILLQIVYDRVFSHLIRNAYDCEEVAILWEIDYYGE
jgi:hypothetical protein